MKEDIDALKDNDNSTEIHAIREVFHTDEFEKFYNDLDARVQKKIDYLIQILREQKVINSELIKKLIDTDFYEMRISIGSNEYRDIIFCVDHDNVIEAKKIILLNGFLKKATKDYKKQISKANNIIKRLKS